MADSIFPIGLRLNEDGTVANTQWISLARAAMTFDQASIDATTEATSEYVQGTRTSPFQIPSRSNPLKVTFFAAAWRITTGNNRMVLVAYQNDSSGEKALGRIASVYTPTSGLDDGPVTGQLYRSDALLLDEPPDGLYVIEIRAYVSGGSATIRANSGTGTPYALALTEVLTLG